MFSEISDQLDIPKTTARQWAKSVELTKEQEKLVDLRLSAARAASINKMAKLNKDRRVKRDEKLLQQAQKIVSSAGLSISHKQVLCATLFWCEGGKDVEAGIQFTNSDPVMISFFVNLLREVFVIDETKFRALMHLHEYHDSVKSLEFWSSLTQIPKEQFHKPYIKSHSAKNQRPDYPGCLSIRYLDSGLGKLLKMIYSELGKQRGVR